MINHIMLSELPPDCPTLPDGASSRLHLLGWTRIDSARMYLDGIQVRCVSGSSCNVHVGADSVEKSPHRCMKCALKFHSCITCSGSCFGHWYLVVTKGGFLVMTGVHYFNGNCNAIMVIIRHQGNIPIGIIDHILKIQRKFAPLPSSPHQV
jgi:hypothetical protein